MYFLFYNYYNNYNQEDKLAIKSDIAYYYSSGVKVAVITGAGYPGEIPNSPYKLDISVLISY